MSEDYEPTPRKVWYRDEKDLVVEKDLRRIVFVGGDLVGIEIYEPNGSKLNRVLIPYSRVLKVGYNNKDDVFNGRASHA